MPRFAEVLDELTSRGGRLLLELKHPHTREDVELVLGMVRAAGIADRVVVQSFRPSILVDVASVAPELPRALLTGTLHDDPLAICQELGLAAYHPAAVDVIARPDVVGELHAAGVATMVWTVNDETLWPELSDLGVDGLISDRAGDVVEWGRGVTGLVWPPRTTAGCAPTPVSRWRAWLARLDRPARRPCCSAGPACSTGWGLLLVRGAADQQRRGDQRTGRAAHRRRAATFRSSSTASTTWVRWGRTWPRRCSRSLGPSCSRCGCPTCCCMRGSWCWCTSWPVGSTRHGWPWLTVALLVLGSDRVVKNQLIAGGGYPEINPARVLLLLLARLGAAPGW